MKRPGIATAEARSALTAVEQGVGEDPICDTGWYAGSNGRAAGSGSKNGITQYTCCVRPVTSAMSCATHRLKGQTAVRGAPHWAGAVIGV